MPIRLVLLGGNAGSVVKGQQVGATLTDAGQESLAGQADEQSLELVGLQGGDDLVDRCDGRGGRGEQSLSESGHGRVDDRVDARGRLDRLDAGGPGEDGLDQGGFGQGGPGNLVKLGELSSGHVGESLGSVDAEQVGTETGDLSR